MNGKSKGGSGGAERRRYERLPVNIEGMLSVNGKVPFPAAMKDFCVAGMFIQVDEDRLATIKAQDTVDFSFRVEPEGHGKLFKLNMKVARVIGAGIGLSFDNAAPATVSLLEKHARRQAGGGGSQEESLSDTQRRFAPSFVRLLPGMMEIVERFGERVIKEFPRVGSEGLFTAARDAGSNQLSRELLDAEGMFSKSGEELRAQVPGVLRQAASTLSNPLASKMRRQREAPKLSLVDKEEFELYLFVSGTISQLETSLKKPLHELNMRLSMLAHRMVESGNNPFGPAVICNAAAEGVKPYLSTAYVSEIVFNSLRRMLEIDLAPFYEELNRLLEAAGIEMLDDPETPPVVKREAPASPSESERKTGKPEAPPEIIDIEAELRALRESVTRITGDLLPETGTVAPPLAPVADLVPPSAMLSESLAGASLGVTTEIPAGGFGQTVQTKSAVLPRGMGAAFSQLRLKRQLAAAISPALGALGMTMGGTAPPAGQLNPVAGGSVMPPLFDVPGSDAAGELAALLGQTVSLPMVEPSAAPPPEAVEIVDGLMRNLIDDPQVATFARSHLRRLGTVARDAAVADPSFITAAEHPMRRLFDRLAELRDIEPADGVRERLDTVLAAVQDRGASDPSTIDAAVREIETLVAEQDSDFQRRIQQVILESAEEQRVIRERRERAGLPPVPPPRQDLSPEWARWLKRAKALETSHDFLMDANTQLPYAVTLVWVGEDHSPYVFVDRKGMKALTLTLEQVATYLRREVLKPLDDDTPALERAMFGVVNQLHEQIAEEATRDPVTGLLNRRGLLDELEAKVPSDGLALCVLSMDAMSLWAQLMPEVDVVEPALAELSTRLKTYAQGKPLTLARIDDAALGLFWERGGVDAARRDLDEIFPLLAAVTLGNPPEEMSTGLTASLAALPNHAGRPERWLERIVEGLPAAREDAERRLIVETVDETQQRQLQQLAAFVERAISRDRLNLCCHEVRGLRTGSHLTAWINLSVEDRAGKLIPPAMVGDAISNPALAWQADQWVLRHALAWLAAQPEDAGGFGAVIVPLSSAALQQESLVDFITQQLMETAVPPARVCFALEERSALANLPEASELIDSLREFGCQFVLDDFGSSQSDHSHVRKLGVEFLVLRHRMLEDARRNTKDLAIVRSLNELAHFMGKLTIASQGPGDSIAGVAEELGIDFLLDQTRVLRL